MARIISGPTISVHVDIYGREDNPREWAGVSVFTNDETALQVACENAGFTANDVAANDDGTVVWVSNDDVNPIRITVFAPSGFTAHDTRAAITPVGATVPAF